MGIGRTIGTHIIEADHRAGAVVRDALRRELQREGWGEGAVELVVLALCEALTNAIEHGSVPGATVEVEIAAADDRAWIRVTDRGRPGSVRPVRVPALPPPSSEHGRGLNIMVALADTVAIREAGNGTEVRLEFSCPPVHRLPAHDISPRLVAA